MTMSNLGAGLALLGLILLVLANLNRQAARRRKQWTARDIFIQRWGTLAAYTLLAFGLLFFLRR